MEQNLEHTISLLARFPGGLSALLRDLPEAWIFSNEGEGTWNAFDVVGHLVHIERNHWIPRVELVLREEESQPFAPVDRWAQKRESEGKTGSQLLDELIELRAANIVKLRSFNIQPQDLSRRGLHPALGPVELSQVLATWVGHDLTHLHQLSRILASQYREAVGPWSAYLGVLQCDGHSG